jgi:hypothetical protein
MKNIQIITALNDEIWYTYAAKSIETWPWQVTIYREGALSEPLWDEWRRNAKLIEGASFKKTAVRFSHKVQSQIHALHNSSADIVIWIDADVTFVRAPTDDELHRVLPTDDEVVTYLDRSQVHIGYQLGMWAETGWLAWNLRHPALGNFLSLWERMYLDNLLWDLPQWHDAWVWDWLRQLTKLPARSISQNSKNSDVWPDSLLGEWSYHHKGPRKINIVEDEKVVDTKSSSPVVLGREILLNRKVGVFIPRIDLSWDLIEPEKGVKSPALKEDTLQVRLHWKAFTARLANALERIGLDVEVYEWPAWKISATEIQRTGVGFAFVPHHCDRDFECGKVKICYYMQEYFRWVFVVDPMGWSASSSAYPFDIKSMKPKRKGVFQEYRRRLAAGELTSKFNQLSRRSRWSLMRSREIPIGKYVFFPLQIPTDQAIRYFSDYSEEEVVTAVIQWSKKSGVPVVFKPHPVSQEAMANFEQQVRAAGCYWSTAHVHDLSAYAAAVFTINSGVGFEALFHLKPVVTFGRAEYDAVTTHGQPDRLDEAWAACIGTRIDDLEKNYGRFVDWFLSAYAVDLSHPVDSNKRLKEIASSVRSKILNEE